MQHSGQRCDQRIERPQVAADEAAHNDGISVVYRHCRTRLFNAVVIRERHRFGLISRCVHPVGGDAIRLEARGARQHMRVSLRKHDDVPGLKPYRIESSHGRPAVALDDHVILDHMICAGHHRSRYFACCNRLRGPLRGEAHVVEHRAAEPNRVQYIR